VLAFISRLFLLGRQFPTCARAPVDVVVVVLFHCLLHLAVQSLQDAKEKMREFCETQTSRKFRCRYNANTQSVWVDRAVAQK